MNLVMSEGLFVIPAKRAWKNCRDEPDAARPFIPAQAGIQRFQSCAPLFKPGQALDLRLRVAFAG